MSTPMNPPGQPGGQPFSSQQMGGAPPPMPESGSDRKGKKGKRKKDTSEAVRRSALTGGSKIAFAIGVFFAVAFAVSLVAGGDDGGDTVEVVVAGQTIPARAALAGSMLEVIEVDAEVVPDEVIAAASVDELFDEHGVDGAFTRQEIPSGAWLYPQYFGAEADVGLTLEPEERMLTIRANIAGALAGRLRAGDEVDIIAVEQGFEVANTIAQGVELVAIDAGEGLLEDAASDQGGEEDKDATRDELLPHAPIPGIYTLRVNAEDVPRFATAELVGDLYLTYRGADAEDFEASPLSFLETFCGDVDDLDPDEFAELPVSCQEGGPTGDVEDFDE